MNPNSRALAAWRRPLCTLVMEIAKNFINLADFPEPAIETFAVAMSFRRRVQSRPGTRCRDEGCRYEIIHRPRAGRFAGPALHSRGRTGSALPDCRAFPGWSRASMRDGTQAQHRHRALC